MFTEFELTKMRQEICNNSGELHTIPRLALQKLIDQATLANKLVGITPTRKELANILCALNHWNDTLSSKGKVEVDAMTPLLDSSPMTVAEIDGLCEKINDYVILQLDNREITTAALPIE